MNSKRKTYLTGTFRALITSVLLHGLVLLGLDVGSWQKSVPEPDKLVVYLALPASEAARIPVSAITSSKKAAYANVPAESALQVQPKAQEMISQAAGEMMVPEEYPETSHGGKPAINDGERAPFVGAAQNLVVLNKEEAFEENRTVPSGTGVPDAESAAPHSPTLRVDSQSSIIHSPLASAMLAFAGDPASLGIIVPDAPDPDLVEAGILSLPEPVYPVLSRKRGEEGRVVVKVLVSVKGELRSAEIIASSSHSMLDRAALEAVKKAAFLPAIVNGRPVESATKLAYRFELEEK